MVSTHYYLTTELEHTKRDSRLAAYGGVVLQQFEGLNLIITTFIMRKFHEWERNGFAGKVNSSYLL